MTNLSIEDNLIGKVLILKLFQDNAFLTVNKQLNTESLRYHSYLKFFNEPSYWIIEVLKHDSIEKKIYVRVLEYQVGDKPFPIEQIVLDYLLDQIEFISFNAIDTIGLLQTVSGNTGKLKHFQSISKAFPEHFQSISKDFDNYNHTILQTEHVSESNEKKFLSQGPLIKTENIKVKILDTTFVDYGVQYAYWYQHKPVYLDFTVSNPTIKKEFEAVKSYFIKVLGTRYFNIELTISEDSGSTTIIRASSKEIDRIDTSTIESIKFDVIKTNLKKHRNSSGELGFTDLDKLKEIKSDQNIIYTLHIDSDELFEKVMQITNAKHYRHLKYLSKLHKPNVMKLRYFLKPFSFLFLLEGKENYIFIWETLRTKEATYLWKVEKDTIKAKAMFKQIEQDIKSIMNLGKLKYLAEDADNFARVYHDYSDPDIGFVEWTKSIEKQV